MKFFCFLLISILFLHGCGSGDSPDSKNLENPNSSSDAVSQKLTVEIDPFFNVGYDKELLLQEIDYLMFKDGTIFEREQKEDSIKYTISFGFKYFVTLDSNGYEYGITVTNEDRKILVTYDKSLGHAFKAGDGITVVVRNNGEFIFASGENLEETILSGDSKDSVDRKILEAYFIENSLPTEIEAYDNFVKYCQNEAEKNFLEYSDSLIENPVSDSNNKKVSVNPYFKIGNFKDVFRVSNNEIVFKDNSWIKRQNFGSDIKYEAWTKNDTVVIFYDNSPNYNIAIWDDNNERIFSMAYDPIEFGYGFQTNDNILLTVSMTGSFRLTTGSDNDEIIYEGELSNSEDEKIFVNYFKERGLPTKFLDYDNLVKYVKQITLTTFNNLDK